MPAIEERMTLPLAENLDRMARTADDLAAALGGRSDAALSRRPAPQSWSAKEVVCHLRDTEEYFGLRLWLSRTLDEPPFPPAEQDRWVEDRQYARQDAEAALVAFRRRRAETLALYRSLGPSDLARGGISSVRGRLTVADHAAIMAWHDDNHLDQLRRALDGKA